LADEHSQAALARWRLVLGRFAEPSLGGSLAGQPQYARIDQVLDYLYGREYHQRGVRGDPSGRQGGMGPSALTVPDWLRHVRELFPQETVEVIQRHALDRYQMTELVTDPEVLRQMQPSYDLLKLVLTFKHMMHGPVLEMARQVVRRVVAALERRLSREIRQSLWGRLNRRHRSHLKVYQNLDVRRTIRGNLKSFDPKRRRIILENLHFFSRVRHHMPWHIVMAVDCSGSMIDSVIHSAVMAGIFRSLPALRVSLVAFATEVIDLSDQAEDPTELLMSIQLGGGTDIGKALQYCEQLVMNPTRTIAILVTDFYEGGRPDRMLASTRRLREAGVKVLGLAALDPQARPVYDHEMAQRCADAGAEVAALTPGRLADWLANTLS
jgi:Mg-chelatase subunit ChlD